MFTAPNSAKTLDDDSQPDRAGVPSSGSLAFGNPPVFPAIPVQYLLDQNERLIARIKLCYGADGACFDAEVLSLIRSYAAYVHLLPASHTRGFSDPGGLFRLGLEVGFFALQGTDAHIFCGRTTISQRLALEPRWRLATFIAGLCSELHLALAALAVTGISGQVWPACLLPLSDWLQQSQTHHYSVDMLSDAPASVASRGYGLFALPHVVPQAVLQHLGSDNTVIVPHLMASISGLVLPQSRNVLDELVRRSLALVLERNLLRRSKQTGKTHGPPQQHHHEHQRHQRHPIGLHHQRFVIDAMRHLLAFSSNWTPNTEKSRVHWGQDGLYLVWPFAGFDLIQLWEQDKLAGLPNNPATLLNFIADLDLCDNLSWPTQGGDIATDANSESGVHAQNQRQPLDEPTEEIQKSVQLHLIRPPGTRAEFQAIRIRFPDTLLSALDPRPVRIDSTLRLPIAMVHASAPGSYINKVGPSPGGASPDKRFTEASSPTPATASEGGPMTNTLLPKRAWRGLVQAAPNGPDSSGMPVERTNSHLLEFDAPHTPTQLTLISEWEGQSTSGASVHAKRVQQKPAALTLIAPWRLSLAIRTLLNQWLALLNSPPTEPHETACVVRSDGLFIPLQRFEAHGFPAFEAIRGLADLKLLVAIGEEVAPTATHMTAEGASIQGIVLSAAVIQGWPPRTAPPQDEPTGPPVGVDGSQVS